MHLLFDLDGTLTDSSPGIIRCINHALGVLGHGPVPEARLLEMIGAPLTSIFAALVPSCNRAVVDRAIGAYRERFDEVGIFENAVYPDVADTLSALRRDGHTMQVVTLKPAVAATRVVEHFGLAPLFAGVHGPALTDRAFDKSALVGTALAAAGVQGSTAVMVGDRAEDVRAARAHGAGAIAAAWGYGPREELIAARPDLVAEHVDDVRRWVLGRG
jgi:phosphoglycolate phosphatase